MTSPKVGARGRRLDIRSRMGSYSIGLRSKGKGGRRAEEGGEWRYFLGKAFPPALQNG